MREDWNDGIVEKWNNGVQIKTKIILFGCITPNALIMMKAVFPNVLCFLFLQRGNQF